METIKKYNAADKLYCYQLRTGTIIRSNGKYIFNSHGFTIDNHSGKLDGSTILIENISFNNNDIIIFWEEN